MRENSFSLEEKGSSAAAGERIQEKPLEDDPSDSAFFPFGMAGVVENEDLCSELCLSNGTSSADVREG